QPGPAPALQNGGELPGEIGAVVDAGIHAEAAGGREQMRSVAGDHDPARLVALGDQGLPRAPGIVADDVHRDVDADRALDPTGNLFGVDIAVAVLRLDQHHELVAALHRAH